MYVSEERSAEKNDRGEVGSGYLNQRNSYLHGGGGWMIYF